MMTPEVTISSLELSTPQILGLLLEIIMEASPHRHDLSSQPLPPKGRGMGLKVPSL